MSGWDLKRRASSNRYGLFGGHTVEASAATPSGDGLIASVRAAGALWSSSARWIVSLDEILVDDGWFVDRASTRQGLKQAKQITRMVISFPLFS